MARKTARQSPSKSAAPERPAWPGIEEVRQLIQLMADNELGELDITDGERRIHLKRGPAAGPVALPGAAFAPGAVPAAAAPAASAPTPAAEAPAAGQPPAEELTEIRSPMVGTFYSSASPDSEPYVSVGSTVQEETVVCIVEAMKVMNEVRAECSGTIAEVCVQNGQPVEYGQVLFRVRPV